MYRKLKNKKKTLSSYFNMRLTACIYVFNLSNQKQKRDEKKKNEILNILQEKSHLFNNIYNNFKILK